ncbi:ARM repeat-containing protein [Schizopora paradoxa]|uniref:Eukaryotic translation initiation factor 3 subunit K n=1 Tax=Schizopora paradoxa TaxID=27342 RepID=A0A0H2RY41_9AGAM|nr:ARM repeat-containing protein [Schizopora paradoxa]
MAATAEWETPSTRPDEIENLVSGVDRYNPSNVSILEDYLYHQTRSNEYDCFANLAILKLYQFNPQLYNPDVVVNVLVKALTAIPFPDFNLCFALLGERPTLNNQDEPDPVPTLLPLLTTLHSHLLQCRYPKFWALFKSSECESLRDNYTVECAGFEDSIREVVIKSVRPAFKKISVERLSTYLDLPAAEVATYVEKLDWKVEGQDVIIPPNQENHIEATVVRENVQFSQLSKIIGHAAKTSAIATA